MPDKLHSLLKEIQGLEQSVEAEIHRLQKGAAFHVHDGKVSFNKEMLRIHRTFKKGIGKYLSESNFLFILSSPVIYAMLVPAVILDIFCLFYQAICFPIYGIPKVSRKQYIRLDRHKLAYLNGIEKLNCDFCAYFNGSLAFAREVASRTEQYWCPIRHALAVKGFHPRYNRFVEFGDAAAYKSKLELLRREVMHEKEHTKKS